jgi:hypothetical protein
MINCTSGCRSNTPPYTRGSTWVAVSGAKPHAAPASSRVSAVDRVLHGPRGQPRMQVERHPRLFQRRPERLEPVLVEVQFVRAEVPVVARTIIT